MHSLHSKAKGLKCIIISKFQSRSREGPFTFADNFLIGYNGYYCVFGSEMPLTALDFRGKYKLVRPEPGPVWPGSWSWVEECWLACVWQVSADDTTHCDAEPLIVILKL